MAPSQLENAPEQAFQGRVVLVTGAAGFLGTHLCRRLVAGGARVHGVSRARRDPGNAGIVWWQRDMEHLEAVRSLFAEVRPDVVYHLSGDVNAAPELRLVLSTFHSLLTSTVNVLTMAEDLRCRRVVLVGSLEEPTAGARTITPASPYGAAKLGMAAYGGMFHRLFRTPVVILRTYMTYGPGQPTWKLIPSTILALLQGRAPRLSSGQRELDWVYVDDVVEAFLRAACLPDLEGETLDLGSGSLVSIRDLVRQIVTLVGAPIEPHFGVLPDRPAEPVRVADVAHAYAKLGWRAAVPLEDGIRRTVAWFRTSPAGGLPPDPAGDRRAGENELATREPER
jgi:nucleoside-diphosphate-sugar epimerase